MPETTNAVVMEEPGKLDIKEFELPNLGPNDILMRVELNGICGTDIHINHGGMDHLDFPILPGHEFAGYVEELGDNVENDEFGVPLTEGDPICGMPFWKVEEDWYSRNMPHREQIFTGIAGLGLASVTTGNVGGMSEYLVMPEQASVYKLPDTLDVTHGALAEPMSIAVHAYERAVEAGFPVMKEGVGLGSSVAVQGVGPIGLLVIAVAAYSGSSQIIAVDAIDDRLDLAREFGATDTVNITDHESDDALVEAVKAKTDSGLGPDAVFECAGIPQAIAQGIEMVHDGGYYVEAGHYAYNGEVEINPTRIVQKELTILGSKAAPSRQFGTGVKILADIADDVPLSDFFNKPVGMTLDEVEDAYETQAAGHALRASIHPHGV